jgi:quercetin dioxygenase-like cupin family protein
MKAPKIRHIQTKISFLLALLLSSTGMAQNSNTPPQEVSRVVASESFENLEWVPCPEPLNFGGCHITVLHGDPSQANSDVLFRMQPGTTAPEHWHNSAERMVLISGEMHVTYQGEDKSILKPGSYAFGPARKPHLAECVGEEPCVLFIAFVQPVDSYVEQ